MCDFDVNSKIMFGLFYEISTIAPVGINASYPRKSNDKHSHQGVCGFGAMDISRSDGCFQNIAVLVSYKLRFTPLTFLLPSMPFWERGSEWRELSLSMAPIVGCVGSPLLSLTFSTMVSSSSEKESIAPQRLK